MQKSFVLYIFRSNMQNKSIEHAPPASSIWILNFERFQNLSAWCDLRHASDVAVREGAKRRGSMLEITFDSRFNMILDLWSDVIFLYQWYYFNVNERNGNDVELVTR